MKTFFYQKERKKGSHTIKFYIYRNVKNKPHFIYELKEDGRGYRGDFKSVCYALMRQGQITASELHKQLNSSWAGEAFNLHQI
jgi:hypothetical protein